MERIKAKIIKILKDKFGKIVMMIIIKVAKVVLQFRDLAEEQAIRVTWEGPGTPITIAQKEGNAPVKNLAGKVKVGFGRWFFSLGEGSQRDFVCASISEFTQQILCIAGLDYLPVSLSDSLLLLAFAYNDMIDTPEVAGESDDEEPSEEQDEHGMPMSAEKKPEKPSNPTLKRLEKFVALMEPPFTRQLTGEDLYGVVLFMQGLPPSGIVELLELCKAHLTSRQPAALEAKSLKEKCVALTLAIADRDEKMARDLRQAFEEGRQQGATTRRRPGPAPISSGGSSLRVCTM